MASEVDFQQLQSFFELSSELMAVLSEDGCFEEANPAWQKNLGYSHSELKDLPFFDLLHPEDLSRSQLEIQKLQQGASRAGFVSRCRRKGQEYRWVNWNCFFLKEEKKFYLLGQDVTSLEETQKALEENKAKFQRLSQSATEGVCIHENGLVLEVNQAFARILGFQSPEEVVGKNGLDFVAPEYRQLAINQIRTGSEEPYEIIGVRRDGTRFHCLVQGKAIQHQGKTVRVTTFQDVTRAKKREQDLFESQELFRRLTEASRDGIAVSDKGVVLIANPSLARMFGREVSEMIGHNALEFTAPEFRETLLKKVLDEVETTYEVMGLRKDGSRFPVEIIPRMTTYQGRRVRVAFFHDITLRKKIEEEVLRQKEFSQNLINSSIDGFLAFDRECRYTLWNPAMERISGHSREEVLGQVAFDVFPFLKQIGEDQHFHSALKGKTSSTQERPYRTPAGRQGFFEAHYMPIKNAAGAILGGLGIVRDVTERMKTQEALRQSEMNLKAVFNNTFQNIVLMDREGMIKAFNPNAAAVFREVSGEDLEVGRPLMDYVLEGHQESVEKFLADARKGEVTQLEYSYPVEEGESHWFEVNYHPVFGASGEIEGICLTSLDIDDRKRVQQALQKSEADLRAVFDNSAQSIILADPKGRVRDFNRLAKEGVQRTRGMVLEVGRPLVDYVEPEFVKPFKERFRRVLKGEILHLERMVQNLEGSSEWFEFTYNPVRDPQGKVIGVCAVATSIDGRKKSEEALQKSESNLRAIFNSSTQGLTVVDREGVIQYFNQVAADFTREFMGKDLQIGQSMTEGLAPAARQSFQEKLQATLKGELVRGEGRYRFGDGSIRWFEYSYHPVRGENGEVAGVCLTSLNIDGRKKAEEALQKSEGQLRSLFDSVNQNIVLMDAQGSIQNFNKSAQATFKAATGKELAPGEAFLHFVQEEDRPEAAGRLQQALQGKPVHVERSYIFSDGSRHWFEFSYHPVTDAGGAITGICFTSQSIDERKKAEEALKDSEEKFRKVFEKAPLGMTLVDKNSRFTHVNRTFCEMLGYTQDELVGKSFRDITHPEDIVHNLAFAQELRKGGSFQRQKRYLRKDGHVLWANLTVQSFLDAQGQFLYSLGMVDDITERKKAAEALRESEEKFRRIFEDASTAMAMLNDYKFIKVNRAFQELLGYGAEEITGKTLFEITHPDDLKKSRTIADKVHHEETDRFQTEKRYVKKNGESLWAHVSGTLIRDGKGEKMYSLVMVEDISQRKGAQEALQKSEEDLKAVFNSGSQVVVLIDPEGNIQNFNPMADGMAQRVLGRPLTKGTPFLRTLPPGADPELFKTRFLAALEGRESQGESCIRSAEGKERWVEVKYQPVLDQKGTVKGVCFSLGFIDERKKAEAAMKESQERLQRFNELTREGILIHENPQVVDVNPALAAMMGYQPEEMRGKSGFDFIAPESREEARRRMEESSAAPYEILALRKDGSTFPAELQGRNYQEKGRSLRAISVRDLTWQKAAERILTESEERYRKLVELLPEAIVVHAAGKVLYVNSAGLKMFTATPEIVEGSSIADFLHPDSRQETLERVRRIMETGESNDWTEQKLIRRDGQVFDAETKGTPLIYQGIPSVMTLVRDITERKKAETALKESEKDYRKLVAEIPLAMVVNGEDGVIVSANSAAARLFRADKSEDLIGKSAMDFTLPENKGIVEGRMRKAVQEGADAENRETEMLALDGRRVQVEIRGIPITLQGKRMVLAILRDVTESKRVHDMLLRYERLAAVGRTIAAIAHEVRNPLAVVSGMSQILKAKLENRSEFHQELETILAQANRLKYFMNDILDYSRNMEIHKGKVNPRRLLEESLVLAQAQLGVAHAASIVEWNIEAGLPDFPADAERLQQVLVNLITNAYQALQGEGTMTLSARTQDGWIFLGVADDGPGIAVEDMPKLFEPFFTTKKDGSGLGLPISQKIAEAHGGKILVERLSARGTLFTLQLPLE